MKTGALDIVYCLKAGSEGEELKYSLRSLKNLEHNRVWIFGDCPDWVENVNFVPIQQTRGNKWLNTAGLLKEICDNDNITEDFIWFNDDFFVLKKMDSLNYYHDRTLNRRVLDFSKISWQATHNAYCRRLLGASRELKFNGKTNLNFELHIPIIFNRAKLKKVIDEHPLVGAKRSLYGNYFVENPIQRDDVKIYDNDNIPNETWDFVSTSDVSFRDGQVGKWVRKHFNRKCEYEKSN